MSSTTIPINTHGGTLSATSNNNSVATAYTSGNDVVISGAGSGICTVTITSGETSNYKSASAGITVNSTATNCQCDKSQCNSYKQDKKKSAPSNCAQQCYNCYSCSCSCSCGGGGD